MNLNFTFLSVSWFTWLPRWFSCGTNSNYEKKNIIWIWFVRKKKENKKKKEAHTLTPSMAKILSISDTFNFSFLVIFLIFPAVLNCCALKTKHVLPPRGCRSHLKLLKKSWRNSTQDIKNFDQAHDGPLPFSQLKGN